MNDVNSAARSFFLLTEIADKLQIGHNNGCKLEYEIEEYGYSRNDNREPRGTIKINIIIHPPAYEAAPEDQRVLGHLLLKAAEVADPLDGGRGEGQEKSIRVGEERTPQAAHDLR